MGIVSAGPFCVQVEHIGGIERSKRVSRFQNGNLSHSGAVIAGDGIGGFATRCRRSVAGIQKLFSFAGNAVVWVDECKSIAGVGGGAVADHDAGFGEVCACW